jgi:hypothetical protein
VPCSGARPLHRRARARQEARPEAEASKTTLVRPANWFYLAADRAGSKEQDCHCTGREGPVSAWTPRNIRQPRPRRCACTAAPWAPFQNLALVLRTQRVIWQISAAPRGNQSTYLFIPTHIRSEVSRGDAIDDLPSQLRTHTRAVCGRRRPMLSAERAHVRSVGMPHATYVPLCSLLCSNAGAQRPAAPSQLPHSQARGKHTATLPFPSCCLTAKLETQTQSNFAPTWTSVRYGVFHTAKRLL